MTREVLHWLLQTIIVAGGIWLFLRFVRVTRGSRLIRGLFLTVVVGIAGIWALSGALQLDELKYLVGRAVPFVVVSFAVVFQPELRRAMAQLGERSLVGRLMSRSREDSLSRIARAARAMAHRRHGALIAFERESSLNTYIEAGTQIDARITARLVESLFNPAGALHDGALIVRKDRLAAAGCFFPLPQEADMDPSLGTRHRSAVGITEESDAVVLVVSEETGAISLARDGKIRTRVPEDELQEALEEWLEKRGLDEVQTKRWTFTRDEAFAVLASVLLAAGLLFFAHQNLTIVKDMLVEIAAVTPSELRAPTKGEILVVLPNENERLLTPLETQRFELEMTGSRAELERVQETLSGVITIDDPTWSGGDLELEQVEWSDDSWMLGIETAWAKGNTPVAKVLRYETTEVELDPDGIDPDTSGMDPRYVVDEDSIVFVPSGTVLLKGSKAELADLELLQEKLVFEPVRIGAYDVGERRYPVRLSAESRQLGFEFLGEEVQVVINVVPQARDIGTINADIAIVAFDPTRAAEIGQWTLPPNLETARFTIQTRGLFDAKADFGTPAMLELMRAIRQAVELQLNVYVDLAELPPEGGGSSLPVRTSWRTDLLTMIDRLGLDPPRVGTFAPLSVRLDSDERVLLSPKTP